MLKWVRKSLGARANVEDLPRCYAQIAALPAGERVIEDLVKQAYGVEVPPASGNEALQRQEGRRNLVSHILRQIEKGRHNHE